MASFIELTQTETLQEADELNLTLQSLGIEVLIEPLPPPPEGSIKHWSVKVAENHWREAQAILVEDAKSKRRPKQKLSPTPIRQPNPIIIGTQDHTPGLYWVIGLIIVNSLIFWLMEVNGGAMSRSVRYRFGASYAPKLLHGEWWRTVTAVFLHLDVHHILANMAALLVLGTLVLRSWGIGRFYLMYIISGIAGNWFSFLINPSPGMKAGASGAILGLLGALAGDRIRTIWREPLIVKARGRYKAWHIIAMVVAFYGMTVGVGPADHWAHIGGLIAGVIQGFLLPPPRYFRERTNLLLDIIFGTVALAIVVTAGLFAYQAAQQGGF